MRRSIVFLFLLFSHIAAFSQCDDLEFISLQLTKPGISYESFFCGTSDNYNLNASVSLKYKGGSGFHCQTFLLSSAGDTIARGDENFPTLSASPGNEELLSFSLAQWQKHCSSSSENVTLIFHVIDDNNNANSISAKKTFLLQLPPRPAPVAVSIKSISFSAPEVYHNKITTKPIIQVFFQNNHPEDNDFYCNAKLISQSGDTILKINRSRQYLQHNKINTIELEEMDFGVFTSYLHRSDKLIKCELEFFCSEQNKLKTSASLPFRYPEIPLPLSLTIKDFKFEYDDQDRQNNIMVELNLHHRLSFSGKEDEFDFAYDYYICNTKGDTLWSKKGTTISTENAAFQRLDNFDYFYSADIPYSAIIKGIKTGGDSCKIIFSAYNPIDPSSKITAQKKFFVDIPLLPCKMLKPESLKINTDAYHEDGSRGITMTCDSHLPAELKKLVTSLQNFDLRENNLCFGVKGPYGNSVKVFTEIDRGNYAGESLIKLHIPFAALQLPSGSYTTEAYCFLMDFFGKTTSDTLSLGKISFTVPPLFIATASVKWTQAPFAEECGYDEHRFRMSTGERNHDRNSMLSPSGFIGETQNFSLAVYENERIDFSVTDQHVQRVLLFFKSRYDHSHFYDSIHPDFSKTEQSINLVHEGKQKASVSLSLQPVSKSANFSVSVLHNEKLNQEAVFVIHAKGKYKTDSEKYSWQIFADVPGKNLQKKNFTVSKNDSSLHCNLYFPYASLTELPDSILIRIVNKEDNSYAAFSEFIDLRMLNELKTAKPELIIEQIKDTVCYGIAGKLIGYTFNVPASMISKDFQNLVYLKSPVALIQSEENQYTSNLSKPGWFIQHEQIFCSACESQWGEINLTAIVTHLSDTVYVNQKKIPFDKTKLVKMELRVSGPRKKKDWNDFKFSGNYYYVIRCGRQVSTLWPDSLARNRPVLHSFYTTKGDSVSVQLMASSYNGSSQYYTADEWKGTCSGKTDIELKPADAWYANRFRKIKITLAEQ